VLFKLTNTLAIFQSFITEVLEDYIDVYIIVYLDDILIFLGSEEEYEKYIRTIMDCLVTVELYSNIKKYCFF